jgi:hypothetical protein
MISHAGLTVLLFGNKIKDNSLEFSEGMREEFEISKSKKNIVLPVGATGYIAKALWEEEFELIKNSKIPDTDYIKLFEKIGDESKKPSEILEAISEIIGYCISKGGVHG